MKVLDLGVLGYLLGSVIMQHPGSQRKGTMLISFKTRKDGKKQRYTFSLKVNTQDDIVWYGIKYILWIV